jgi:histidinol-phosphate aminotransferase
VPVTAIEPTIVVGIGAGHGISAAELKNLVVSALAQAGLGEEAVTTLATVDTKSSEDAIQQLASDLAVPIVLHSADLLTRVKVPNPSDRVAATVGTPSVAEAAALVALPAQPGVPRPNIIELLVPKTASPRATVAVARHMVDPVDLYHHGDAEVGDGLLDLAVNVRPDPLPEWLAAAIRHGCEDLAAYPDARFATAAVAQRHGRDPAEVLLTAGAAEAFTLMAQGISRSRALAVHPQFTEPERALRAARWQVDRLLLTPSDGFVLDPAAVSDVADLVVVGNPTNPTGTLHRREALLKLRRPGRVLLVDEAFMDSVPREAETLLDEEDLSGVLVVRSLTKTWGLAGLRIGYLVGDPSLIARLREVQPRWAVSTPALHAAIACMSAEARTESARRTAMMIRDREVVRSALQERRFSVAKHSHGPFLTTRHPRRESIHRELRERGIAVRRADTFPGLGLGWVRISVRDAAATQRLLAALDEVLGE